MAENINRSAVINVIRQQIDEERFCEMLHQRLTIQFEAPLCSQMSEFVVRHYDRHLIMVTTHVPRVRWSIYFIPIPLVYPGLVPDAQAFSGRFGQMRM